jgi:CubicO group peptidase (beta-lactamase class C family)
VIQRSLPLGQFGYSGAGFVYLQQALEAIWKEPAIQYTRRLILDPLGMRQSSFVWRDEYAETASRGFEPDKGALDPWRPMEVNGASSLHTTAREYALLLEAYLGEELRQRHPDVYRSQADINARLGWSLGWGTAGDVLWQWGHNDGFRAFAALAPRDGLGIVILTNGAGGQRINREWANAWLGADLPVFYFGRIQL